MSKLSTLYLSSSYEDRSRIPVLEDVSSAKQHNSRLKLDARLLLSQPGRIDINTSDADTELFYKIYGEFQRANIGCTEISTKTILLKSTHGSTHLVRETSIIFKNESFRISRHAVIYL